MADGARGVAAGPVACGLTVDVRAAGEGHVASPRGLLVWYSFFGIFSLNNRAILVIS